MIIGERFAAALRGLETFFRIRAAFGHLDLRDFDEQYAHTDGYTYEVEALEEDGDFILGDYGNNRHLTLSPGEMDPRMLLMIYEFINNH